MATLEEVLAVMRERAEAVLALAPETIGEQTDLAGAGPDSLALVEWFMGVEDALGIDLSAAAGETRVGLLAELAVGLSQSVG